LERKLARFRGWFIKLLLGSDQEREAVLTVSLTGKSSA